MVLLWLFNNIFFFLHFPSAEPLALPVPAPAADETVKANLTGRRDS